MNPKDSHYFWNSEAARYFTLAFDSFLFIKQQHTDIHTVPKAFVGHFSLTVSVEENLKESSHIRTHHTIDCGHHCHPWES